METPAAAAAALLQLVEFSLETLEDIERIAEAGLREGLGSGHGTSAAATQQQQHVVAPHLRLELAHETRILLQIRASAWM